MRADIGRIALLVCISALCGCARYAGTPEEVVFKGSGGTELHGTLVFPKDVETPVPAVVLLHGAERATRTLVYRMHANVFVERGFAALVYDKRGAGESGGDHEKTTYAELVEDAVQAVSLLRGRPGVDPRRVGLVGASESGWLTPEIAERSGDIAFVINKVGPALSWRETVAWEVQHDLVADGVSEASAREQAAVRRRLWDYYIAPTEEERAALEETLAAWAGQEDSRLPAAVGEVDPSVVATISYDPTPYLERLTVPMLYVYGEEDINVPTAACVERLEELAARGKPVTSHTYEGEGHELGGVGLFPPGYSFVDGYSKLIGDFAVQHAGR